MTTPMPTQAQLHQAEASALVLRNHCREKVSKSRRELAAAEVELAQAEAEYQRIEEMVEQADAPKLRDLP